MNKRLSTKNRKDIIQWDVENWSKCLDFWAKNSDLRETKKILALGEREGGISLYFALQGHDVICSDFHPMPETTIKMHHEYGVEKRVSYAEIDMKAINMPDESVDVIVFKSVIGALGNVDDQAKAVAEIYRVLKKDGTFLLAENLAGSSLHSYLRKKFVHWGERWRYIKAEEILRWGDEFTSKKIKVYGVLALFGRSERQRQFLSFFDRFITPVTPKNWRYILFGVFKK